jgi:hypothetical protein
MANKRALKTTDQLKSKRPTKKQRRLDAYHSDSDEEAGEQQDFKAVNLDHSDGDDLDDVAVDDLGGSEDDGSAQSEDEEADYQPRRKKTKKQAATDEGDFDAEDDHDDDSEADSDKASDASSGEDSNPNFTKAKSKRNDPTAFAASLSKILDTKLSTSRRKDPVLAGSAAAHATSRAITESALEVKARKQLREAKRVAMEKGRVRNVLAPIPAAPSVAAVTKDGKVIANKGASVSEEITTAQLLETERRLRKVAQRGVVKLFNAVRAAQVKAVEAERTARAEGIVGQGAREERVTEMSRKGFLDLIAQGGGKMKKGRLEEA